LLLASSTITIELKLNNIPEIRKSTLQYILRHSRHRTIHNNSTGKGIAGYEDNSSQIASMQIGVSLSATIGFTSPSSSDQLLIWIDWNKDGDFMDPGENVYSTAVYITSPHTTTSFSPPAGTIPGKTVMRIRLHDLSYGPNSTPCGVSSYGEVEDYSIDVAAR
jgi:trimeric autotransporter adhesin